MDKLSKAIQVLEDQINYSVRNMDEVSVELDFESADVILELLKEQLPVKPLYITDKEWCFKRFVCRNCRLPLHYEFVNNGVNNAYCSRCGRKIAWDKVKAKRRKPKDGDE